MIKKFAILSLFLPFVLASCSSDEPGKNGDNGKDLGYVAVNIVQPNQADVRAANSGFEYGNDTENFAKDALFFIFDGSGNILSTNGAQRKTLNGHGEGNNPEVERIYNAVLLINGENEKPNNTKQIVCVLNAPDKFEEGISSISNLKDKIDAYGTHSKGTFIMSNSVYKNGDTEVFATQITEEYIKTSESEALTDPVNIYVERVVAKIQVETQQASEGGFSNTDAQVTIDGEQKTFKIKITGIEIANIAEKSYMFKNIADIATTEDMSFDWNWNDVTNKRSYWETVPTKDKGMTFANKSYTQITSTNPITNINELTGDKKYIEYVQPNTTKGQNTAVLVTAELTNEDGSAINDFVYIRGGYTTDEGAKNVVATYLAAKDFYKKVGDNTYRQLEATDLEWKNGHDDSSITGLKDYEVIAQLKNDMIIYHFDGTPYTNGTSAVNTALKEATSYRARVYTKGMCYYFVPIDHTSVAKAYGYTGTKTYNGVVRNHIYKLTLQSIQGLGTPVFDPKDVIIPDKPSDENMYYLAAKINVLAWRLATQNVNFQGQ